MSEKWVSARYTGKCSECDCDFSEGEEILWVPNDGRRADTYCKNCGQEYMETEIKDFKDDYVNDYEVEF